MTSTVTAGLPLFQRVAPVPAVRDVAIHLRKLIGVLSDRQWHTAKELKVHGFTDRELRELVEDSEGRIFSYPGSPGYKLFEAVTIKEFEACRSLFNQANAMKRRYIRYCRRFHQGK